MKEELEKYLPSGHLYDTSFIDDAREALKAGEEFDEIHFMDEDIYPDHVVNLEGDFYEELSRKPI